MRGESGEVEVRITLGAHRGRPRGPTYRVALLDKAAGVGSLAEVQGIATLWDGTCALSEGLRKEAPEPRRSRAAARLNDAYQALREREHRRAAAQAR